MDLTNALLYVFSAMTCLTYNFLSIVVHLLLFPIKKSDLI